MRLGLTLTITIFCFGFCSCNTKPDQAIPDLTNQQIEKALLQSENLLCHHEIDSALFRLRPIWEKVQEVNHPLARKIRLAYSLVLEQNYDYLKAILLLNELKDKSKKAEEWETFAEACLALAKIHRKIQRVNISKKNLELAKKVIRDHQFTKLEPTYFLRHAFWHHDFGYPDSTAYFANRVLALEYAEDFDCPRQKIEYEILLGHLYSQQKHQTSIKHYKKALQIAKEINSYGEMSYIYSLLRHQYSLVGDTDLEHQNNLAMIKACYRAIEAKEEYPGMLSEAYINISKYFKKRHQFDSAFHYLRKGSSQKEALLKKLERYKIVEVDAQYYDEKKSIQLAEQQQQINTDRKTKSLLILIVLLAIALIVIMIRNSRKQKQSNQKLQQQAEQLANLDKMKSRFFANISHELRTPLTLINGPIQSLNQQLQLSQKHQRLLEIAQKNGKQLELLINEILNLEKLSNSQLQLKLQSTDLYHFFNRIIPQFESQATFKEIDFSYQIKLDKGLTAMIDHEKYRQILFNLLSNAIKYSEKGDRVTATILIKNKNLETVVTNTGKGIPAEDLPHVFDRFFQSSKSNEPIQGGTGIGLAICKEYSELMGGHITVKSRLRQGTAFTVTTPLQFQRSNIDNENAFENHSLNEVKPIMTEPLSIKTTASKQKKAKLLLVEDNPALQEYLQLILREQYLIEITKNGLEAWKLLEKEHNFQLIISDLMMPIMDGQQLLEKLKSNYSTRHIPIIILTARADFKTKIQSLRLGVDDYLLKPFDEFELKTRVENLLNNYQVRRELASAKITDQETTPKLNTEDQQWLTSFELYINANIGSDILSVQLMADKFAMSRSTLLRQLKRLSGLSPKQYLQEARLQKARNLLESRTNKSITEIAISIGYNDVRSFSRVYKKRYGKLPSEV